MKRLDVVLAAGLKIDSLPDTTGIAITLLSVEVGIAGSVVCLDQDLLFPSETYILQFALEGSIAALVASDLLAIQPDLGVPV